MSINPVEWQHIQEKLNTNSRILKYDVRIHDHETLCVTTSIKLFDGRKFAVVTFVDKITVIELELDDLCNRIKLDISNEIAKFLVGRQ